MTAANLLDRVRWKRARLWVLICDLQHLWTTLGVVFCPHRIIYSIEEAFEMSKEKSINKLLRSSKKRVYVFLADKETEAKFIADANAEGYVFEDGTTLLERTSSNLYALNRNKTVNYLNTIGRIAFQCNSKHIVRVDYKKYIDGNEDYYYG